MEFSQTLWLLLELLHYWGLHNLHLTWNYGLLGLLKPVWGFSLHTSIWPFSVAQTNTPLWASHLHLSPSVAQSAVLQWSPHFYQTWMYDGLLLLSSRGLTHGNRMTKGLGYDILYNHFVCVCVCVCVCVHAQTHIYGYGFVNVWMYTCELTLKHMCAACGWMYA